MPAFSFRHIKDLYPVFWAKSVQMAKLIEEHIHRRQAAGEDNVVRMRDWGSRATLDIIGVAGMDQDFQALSNPDNELNRQYRLIVSEPSLFEEAIFLIGMLTSTQWLVRKLPLTRNRQMKKASAYIRGTARQMVRQKKLKLKGKKEAEEEEGLGKRRDIDIISVALESGSFTEENLVDQMMTFLAAGHETTAGSLEWAVYSLAKHQDVQTRLREEVRANLPSVSWSESAEQPPISAAAVDALPYLNAVCNEVLRFYPPVRFTCRMASRDTEIVGNYIPKGTVVSFRPDVVNRSETLWGPDAATFQPERWMGPGQANTGGASSNYGVLTFLHGPRSCIGQGFSKSELACLVAVVVGRFHLELADPNKELEITRGGVTTKPRDGALVRLTPLEGW